MGQVSSSRVTSKNDTKNRFVVMTIWYRSEKINPKISSVFLNESWCIWWHRSLWTFCTRRLYGIKDVGGWVARSSFNRGRRCVVEQVGFKAKPGWLPAVPLPGPSALGKLLDPLSVNTRGHVCLRNCEGSIPGAVCLQSWEDWRGFGASP